MEEKKKLYEAPQIDVIEVEPASIICTSPSSTSTQNEEYNEVSTEVTDVWFQ